MEDEENKKAVSITAPPTKDNIPLLKDLVEETLYKRRWYVLGVFSYAAFLQTAVWNTFGPIAQSAKLVFGWSDANIGMLANWGNILYFVFMIPMAWIMDVKGLRVSLLVCVTLIMLGTTVRCLTSQPELATWLINIACVLNGVAGTVPFAGPALLSATWFPVKQRSTATAISFVACYLGLSAAFLIGPFLVPEPKPSSINTTNVLSVNVSGLGNNTHGISNATLTLDYDIQRTGIMRLLYIECGAAVVLFLLVLVYFPAKPPTPPSHTASIERASYKDGLTQLIKHKQFLLIMLAYSIPTGVNGVFATVLNVLLHKVNISQKSVGWLGFYSTLGGCAVQLLISRISDLFMRHIKMLLLFVTTLATAATAWFVSLQMKESFFDIVSIYISSIASTVLIIGSVPLFYELGCEASYPIAEGVTAGMLTLVNNLSGIIFLSVLQIPNIGVFWMNWALLGSVAVSIPLLLVFKETYNRTDIDTEIIVPDPGKCQTKYSTDNKEMLTRK